MDLPRRYARQRKIRVLRKAREIPEASAWCLVFLAWTTKAGSIFINPNGLYVKMELLGD